MNTAATTPRVHQFDAAPARPGEDYFLPADRLIAGNPKQTVWMDYTDPTQKFCTGQWRSETGKWRIAYTEEEYCEILEGRSVIADAAGHEVTVRPGDRFVIPRGFVGSWEVVDATRKRFVIYESGA